MSKVNELLQAASEYKGNARASFLKSAAREMITARLEFAQLETIVWEPMEWNGD